MLAQVTISGASSYQVIDIPGDSPSTPYLIPASSLGTSSALALDGSGNLDVVEKTNGAVSQLDYLNPINMGSQIVGSGGPIGIVKRPQGVARALTGAVPEVTNTATEILFNFEFNGVTALSGFRELTVGDTITDVSQVVADGTCGALPNTVSEYEPYICDENFVATPRFPGMRVSAIQVEGPGTEILASRLVYETGNSGAAMLYPMQATTTVTAPQQPLEQPQGVAISGFNDQVYIADFDAGYVYYTSGLTGTGLSVVGTGNIVLSAPSAVAMNGEGDLYIADFDLGEVVVVPTTTGIAPYVLQTGFLLQHPISLALDYLGNLYVGDAGQGGTSAVSTNPGYVVKVLPRNAGVSKVAINSPTGIIFPQALATDPVNGSLYIGDGGSSATTNGGQVVKLLAERNSLSGFGPRQPCRAFRRCGGRPLCSRRFG